MHSCLLENCVWNAVVVVFRCVALVTSSSSGCKCEGRGRVSCKCRSFLPQFVLEPFQSNGSLLWRCALMKYLGWVLVDHKVHETICLVGPNALPYCLKGGSIQYQSTEYSQPATCIAGPPTLNTNQYAQLLGNRREGTDKMKR